MLEAAIFLYWRWRSAKEYRYSSTLSLTSKLDGLGGELHAPAALRLGKTRYPFYWRLGRPQCRSGRVWNISPPPGFDPRTVQPVAIPTELSRPTLPFRYKQKLVNFINENDHRVL